MTAIVLDSTIDADQDARVIAAAERFERRHNLRLSLHVGVGREADAVDFANAVYSAVHYNARLRHLWDAAMCRALRVPYDSGITLHRDSGTGALRIAYLREW